MFYWEAARQWLLYSPCHSGALATVYVVNVEGKIPTRYNPQDRRYHVLQIRYPLSSITVQYHCCPRCMYLPIVGDGDAAQCDAWLRLFLFLGKWVCVSSVSKLHPEISGLVLMLRPAGRFFSGWSACQLIVGTEVASPSVYLACSRAFDHVDIHHHYHHAYVFLRNRRVSRRIHTPKNLRLKIRELLP